MIRFIDDYELVKQKIHTKYKTAGDFYLDKSLCKQNFLKYYRRYINALVPHKTGSKFPDIIKYEKEITAL